jgi:hypothetical protein
MSTAQLIAYAVVFVIFIGIYVRLRASVARQTGLAPPVPWKWLGVSIGIAAVVILIGVLVR